MNILQLLGLEPEKVATIIMIVAGIIVVIIISIIITTIVSLLSRGATDAKKTGIHPAVKGDKTK